MSKANLKFGSNGKFKILQVSDFQDGLTQRYLTMENVLKCVEEYKPDLIMITGDNKFSTTGKQSSLYNVLNRASHGDKNKSF